MPEQFAYCNRVRRIHDEHLPADREARSGLDTSSEYVTAFSRVFCPILAREGLLTPRWPTACGGADARLRGILNEEMAFADEPRSYQYMSLNRVGPALIKFGIDARRAVHLSRISAGEMFYRHGFSEPDARSDLAALKTRARRNVDRYVICDQKIWTSPASVEDYCALLARTGNCRKDITASLIPMAAGRDFHARHSGASRRTDVPRNLPRQCPRAGGHGTRRGAWRVGRRHDILHNGRIGMPCYMISLRGLDSAVARLQREGWLCAAEAARAGQARSACEGARLHCYRVIDGRVKNEPATIEIGLARYAMTRCGRLVADFFIGEFCDPCLVANDELAISAAYRRGQAAGLAEIQLKLIARNNLGLKGAA